MSQTASLRDSAINTPPGMRPPRKDSQALLGAVAGSPSQVQRTAGVKQLATLLIVRFEEVSHENQQANEALRADSKLKDRESPFRLECFLQQNRARHAGSASTSGEAVAWRLVS